MRKYKFTINEKEYNVVVKGIDDEIAELEVNGNPYEVKIHQLEQKVPKTPILVRKEVQNKPGENKVAEKSGTIVKVCVAPGASVMQDEALFEIQ